MVVEIYTEGGKLLIRKQLGSCLETALVAATEVATLIKASVAFSVKRDGQLFATGLAFRKRKLATV